MPRSQSPSDRAPRTSVTDAAGGAADAPTATADTDRLPDDVAAMSYEDARDELVRVVARLEAGGETLEGALALWERGESLAARCQQWLDGARARLDAARGPGDAVDERGGTPSNAPDDEEGR